TPRRAAELVATLARATHYAHQRGVIHRDLKPANVLLDRDGGLYISDFGIARKGPDGGQTRIGEILGTPSYMAPEQARAQTPPPALDVYALGAILYECLAGRPPFKELVAYETIKRVLEDEPPPIEGDLGVIALRCLRKDPAARYDSALALAEDLERW